MKNDFSWPEFLIGLGCGSTLMLLAALIDAGIQEKTPPAVSAPLPVMPVPRPWQIDSGLSRRVDRQLGVACYTINEGITCLYIGKDKMDAAYEKERLATHDPKEKRDY